MRCSVYGGSRPLRLAGALHMRLPLHLLLGVWCPLSESKQYYNHCGPALELHRVTLVIIPNGLKDHPEIAQCEPHKRKLC